LTGIVPVYFVYIEPSRKIEEMLWRIGHASKRALCKFIYTCWCFFLILIAALKDVTSRCPSLTPQGV
jgi:hypothetical protein